MFWFTLLVGFGLYLSPLILGIATHVPDVRLGLVLGMTIGTASFWGLFDEQAGRWPAAIICLAGLMTVMTALLLSTDGHTRWLSAALPLGSLAAGLGAWAWRRPA